MGPERGVVTRLESMDLDGLGIKLKTFLLIGQKLLNILALVSLQLNHLAHLGIVDDGAIASWVTLVKLDDLNSREEHTEFLLDHLQNLLLVKLLGKTLDGGQGLTTIAFCKRKVSHPSVIRRHSTRCQEHNRTKRKKKRKKKKRITIYEIEHTLNPYMDVILRLFSLAGVFVSFGEGVCGTGTC